MTSGTYCIFRSSVPLSLSVLAISWTISFHPASMAPGDLFGSGTAVEVESMPSLLVGVGAAGAAAAGVESSLIS